MSRPVVAVTGSTGFVGGAVMAALTRSAEWEGRPVVRDISSGTGTPVGNIGPDTDWMEALEGVDCIVHAAGNNGGGDAASIHAVNVGGTRSLAEQAATLGVRRLVFLSSAKVFGEASEPGHAFRPSDPPKPVSEYARSKAQAERQLGELGERTGLEITVLRPPMVYGPGVGGNFALLVKLVGSGVPLPFGAVRNRRSMVAIDNLVDLILTCLDAPAAAGGTFTVADPQDVSTPELMRLIGRGMGKRVRLLPVPTWMLQTAGTVTGRSQQLDRLLGNLQLDTTVTRRVLSWSPPVSVEEGIVAAVRSDDQDQRGDAG